jgi:hypothetical protein
MCEPCEKMTYRIILLASEARTSNNEKSTFIIEKKSIKLLLIL